MTAPIAGEANQIMYSETDISERQKREQERVFRLANRDYGLTLKAISLDSGIAYNTIQGYASGSAVMSIASLFKLVGVIPDALLSLLLPDGRAIVAMPEGVDIDEVELACRDLLAAKGEAHRPESEAGREIGPNEKHMLDGKVVQLRGKVAA